MTFYIDDWLAQNYSELRVQRCWTWAQMADDFDKQGAPQLATWARSLDVSRRTDPKQVERAVTTPQTRRTK